MSSVPEKIKSLGRAVNARLAELMDEFCDPGILKDAMNYSLNAGGKRLRPVLCLMSAGMYGGYAEALDYACAIEMIHTYSLIHDDLPAMDNDDFRRGKPSSHKVFGEAFAVLAGDGLLNCAFEVMMRRALENPAKAGDYIRAADIIAGAAGVRGMIAGQAADIEFEGAAQDADTLNYIHDRKTAALITASAVSGAAIKGAPAADLSALEIYGRRLGLAFQITDDILDEQGDGLVLGKTPGKDAVSDKQTFARLYGIEKSKLLARQMTQEAADALERFGDRARDLIDTAFFLLEREY